MRITRPSLGSKEFGEPRAPFDDGPGLDKPDEMVEHTGRRLRGLLRTCPYQRIEDLVYQATNDLERHERLPVRVTTGQFHRRPIRFQLVIADQDERVRVEVRHVMFEEHVEQHASPVPLLRHVGQHRVPRSAEAVDPGSEAAVIPRGMGQLVCQDRAELRARETRHERQT